MAIPSSGTLSLNSIRNERETGNYSAGTQYSATSLQAMGQYFGDSAPHGMSELYGLSGATPIALHGVGISSSAVWSENLSSNSSWQTRTITFDSGWRSINQRQARVVWLYKNGTSGTHYLGDVQLDELNLWAGGGHSAFNGGNIMAWQYGASLQWAYDSTASLGYGSLSWTSVASGTNQGRWNYDSGGTPSSPTGLSTGDPNGDTSYGDNYIYAETSGNSTGGDHYWLRTSALSIPTLNLTTTDPTINFSLGAYGSNVGTLELYIDRIN